VLWPRTAGQRGTAGAVVARGLVGDGGGGELVLGGRRGRMEGGRRCLCASTRVLMPKALFGSRVSASFIRGVLGGIKSPVEFYPRGL
jgi:hypothetical protein